MGVELWQVGVVVVAAIVAIVVKDWSKSPLYQQIKQTNKPDQKTVSQEKRVYQVLFDRDAVEFTFDLWRLVTSECRKGEKPVRIRKDKNLQVGIQTHHGFWAMYTLNKKGVWYSADGKKVAWVDGNVIRVDADLNTKMNALNTPVSVGVRPTRQPDPNYGFEPEFEEAYS